MTCNLANKLTSNFARTKIENVNEIFAKQDGK